MSRYRKPKALRWVGSSKDDLREFPQTVREQLGFDLFKLENGEVPVRAKALSGNDLSGVMELKENFDGETYRVVYIAKLKSAIYVLHSFQKKSKSGIKTPPKDIQLIKDRLKLALDDDNRNSSK